MSKIRGVLISTVLAAPMLLLPAGPASAEERVCRGTIGATTVDNLLVPQYASCVLLGTRVKGTIKVEFNATLRAEDVVVIGNALSRGNPDIEYTLDSDLRFASMAETVKEKIFMPIAC